MRSIRFIRQACTASLAPASTRVRAPHTRRVVEGTLAKALGSYIAASRRHRSCALLRSGIHFHDRIAAGSPRRCHSGDQAPQGLAMSARPPLGLRLGAKALLNAPPLMTAYMHIVPVVGILRNSGKRANSCSPSTASRCTRIAFNWIQLLTGSATPDLFKRRLKPKTMRVYCSSRSRNRPTYDQTIPIVECDPPSAR